MNDEVTAANAEYRLAGGNGGGAVADAQALVNRERQRINRARSLVADLSNQESRLTRETTEALERCHVLTNELGEVKAKLADARAALAAIEPPEQPAAAPAPALEPVVERGPEPERPYRTVSALGSRTRHYNRAGVEVDAQNRPLADSLESAVEPSAAS